MMTAMLELTPDNVCDYLRDRGFRNVRGFEPLPGGISNVVFRVETDDRLLVLKQSRPQLRTEAPWFSDLSRIFREIEVMESLHPALPEVVPEVVLRDDENYAFVMSHAPVPCRDWRSVLLSGEVDPKLGAEAGRILGRIHASLPFDERHRFADRSAFHQLRTDPFYGHISDRHPDLAEPIGSLIRCLSECRGYALCHGDFSPKNLLLHSRGFFLVDYETAHWGEFNFDIGFFLSHILLKGIHRPAQWEQFAELSQLFLSNWRREFPFNPWGEHIVVWHAAACLLARVDGKSPAPYLTACGQRDTAREIAREILLNRRYSTWRAVLRLTEDRCRYLAHSEPDPKS
jgi:5-methylthioribose kinase